MSNRAPVIAAVTGLLVAASAPVSSAGAGHATPGTVVGGGAALALDQPAASWLARSVSVPEPPRPTRPVEALEVAVTADLALKGGGDGVAEVALARVSPSKTSVHDVSVRIRLPRVLRSGGIAGAGWRCDRRRRLVRCTQARQTIAAGRVPGLKLTLDAAPQRGASAGRRFGRGALAATASWSERVGSRLRRMRAADRLIVRARRPLAVRAGAPDRHVGDRVRGSEPVPVVLTGVVRRLTHAPARYRWRQLCPHPPRVCVRVRFNGRRAGDITSPRMATSFAVPQVARAQRLRFELAVSDSRGRATDTVSVRVRPHEVARVAPRLDTTEIADRLLAPDRDRSGHPVPLDGGDRAHVHVGRPGPTTVRAGAPLRLQADVRGASERRVRWAVVHGPQDLLAGARRRGRAIRFDAPRRPQTLIVRMSARTADGLFRRDELISVLPASRARPASARASSAPAQVAGGQDPQTRAFCRLLADARERKRVSIELDSGARFDAQVSAVEPAAGACTGAETVRFAGGTSELGAFRLANLGGTVTRSGGLAVLSGRLEAPDFWSTGSGGPTLDFQLPDRVTDGVRVGVGARLAADGTWGNLAGELVLEQASLAKLPIVGALPAGWRMETVRLAVDPSARRFELSAQARGPPTTSREATLGFDGSLSFDGRARISVVAANLAVLQSPEGQVTVSAQGQLDLLPGRRFDPGRQGAGSYFPVVEVAVSGSIHDYRPAPGLKLDGEVSWSTSGPLRIAGTLVASVKGEDLTATVAGSYTNARNWSLDAALRSQTGFRVGGLFTLVTLEGSVTRAEDAIAVNLVGEVRDAGEIGGITLRRAKATLTNSGCNFEGPLQDTVRRAAKATDAKPVCLVVDGDIDLRIPGRAQPLAVKGGLVVDLATLRFSVSGGLSSETSFGPTEFNLSSVRLWATNTPAARAVCGAGTAAASTRPARGLPARAAAGAGLSFGFSARGRVLGIDLTSVAGAYTAGGDYCLSAELAASNLPGSNGAGSALKPVAEAPAAGCNVANAPALQGLRLTYSSVTKVARLGDGRFCLPEGLRKVLGPVGQGTGAVDLTVSFAGGKPGITGRFTYTLPQRRWLIGATNATGTEPDRTKAALGFDGVAFTFSASATGVDLQLDAQGALRMPDPDPRQFGAASGSAVAPLKVAATARLGAEPGFSLTTTLGTVPAVCTEQVAVLRDLFGQRGLNICSLGLAGTLGPAPSLAASASFTLPSAWTRDLGISNASYYVGFNVSAANPCLDLAINQIDKSKPAIDLFNKGALVANKLQLTIAPTGCRLPESSNIPGQLSRDLPAGFNLAFEGLIAKTPVKLNVSLERRDASFKFDANLEIGSWQAGPVEFGATTIKVLLDPSTSTYRIGVKTSAKFGDGLFSLDANFDSSGSGTSRTVSLQGSAALRFRLGLAKFNGAMTFSFRSAQSGTTASFSGHFDLDLVVFSASVDIRKLEYDSTKGGLQYLDVSAQAAAGSRFGLAAFSATGGVYYSRAEDKIRLDFNVKIRLWTIPIKEYHLQTELSKIEVPFQIGASGGQVNIGFRLGRLELRGAIAGALTWSPSTGVRVRIDQGFSLNVCSFGSCWRIFGADVNSTTGVVTLRVFGIPIAIPPERYGA